MYREVINRLAELTTTAFGLVAALAWNATIQGWFENAESLRAGGPLVYAMLVTVIAVLATVAIGRVSARAMVLAKDEEAAAEAGAEAG